MRPNTPEIFWSRVRKTTDCWEWTGGMRPNGYGYFRFKGKYVSAHRFAWTDTFGQIPEGLHVCHRCDNRQCVRPDHLFIGTAQDNQADKVAKGRQAHGPTHGWHTKPDSRPRGERHWTRMEKNKMRLVRGEKQHAAKLTSADIPVIRQRRSDGERLKVIAKDYGVTVQVISGIAKRKAWTHV